MENRNAGLMELACTKIEKKCMIDEVMSRSQQKRIAVMQGKPMPMFLPCNHCERAAVKPDLHYDRWYSAEAECWMHIVDGQQVVCENSSRR
jgi:hypothetical protein